MMGMRKEEFEGEVGKCKKERVVGRFKLEGVRKGEGVMIGECCSGE